MAKNERTRETEFYWKIADGFLSRANVDQGRLMGLPCLRVNGDFFSTCEHRSGDLIVNLPRDRVAELIDAGQGEPFAPAGKIFKEWLRVERRHTKKWQRLMDEALQFVGSPKA